MHWFGPLIRFFRLKHDGSPSSQRSGYVSQLASSHDLKKHTQRYVALSFNTGKHNHPLQTLLPPIKSGTRFTKHRERYSAQQKLPPATAGNQSHGAHPLCKTQIHPCIHQCIHPFIYRSKWVTPFSCSWA